MIPRRGSVFKAGMPLSAYSDAPAIAGLNPQLVDMVVVLGKGVLWQLKSFPQLNVKTSMPSHEWAYVDQNDKNLLTLFLHLLMYVTSASTPPQVASYASKTTFSSVQTC